MTLVTLYRQAPVAPDSAHCRLCDTSIAGKLQDQLLTGQPGTPQDRIAICPRCGEALGRLVGLFGNDIKFVIQDARPSIQSLVGIAGHAQPAPSLHEARERLAKEADSLDRSVASVRAEVDKLGALGEGG